MSGDRVPGGQRPAVTDLVPRHRHRGIGRRIRLCHWRSDRKGHGQGGRGQGGGRWYSVGRLNYSMKDRKLVDTVVGFEYDSCCWIGRVVLERLQSSVTTSNTRLLFQIEFVGFSRLSLGASPLETLRRNVPRYQYLREQVSTPSRFSNYD